MGGKKSELDAQNHLQQENHGMVYLHFTRSFDGFQDAYKKMET